MNHPNICTIHDIGEHDGPGLHGHGVPRRPDPEAPDCWKPLEPEQVLSLGIEIAHALDAAHGEGIVHRDIEPANIFITNQGFCTALELMSNR